MSFLDNLENSLKALEGLDEADPEKKRREQAQREAARQAALLTAPNADRLKTSEFTAQLLTACRIEGHRLRQLVRFTWLDSMLRLDAPEKRMELAATPAGVTATFWVDGEVRHSEQVDFAGDPADLARRWLSS